MSAETQTQKPQRSRGTQQTEAIVGTAARKMALSLKSYEEAQEVIKKLPELIETYTLQVADLEDKINGLSDLYETTKKRNEIELELEAKQNIEMVVNKYLASNGKTVIIVEDLENLETKAALAGEKFQNELAKELGAQTAILKNNHQNELKLMEATYAQKEASNLAELKSLTSQLMAAKAEAARWEAALNEERKAGTERAKANAIGAVNLTSQK